MDYLIKLLSSEAMNAEIISGVSYGFALIFFAPLFLVAIVFLAYGIVSRRSILVPAKWLTILWLVACVPAAMLILMGYAFNSSKLNPLITVPLWVVSGLLTIWFPVALRVIFGIRPV